jgi:hypothetical protein
MTTPTLRAIKCSERMPTREDANCDGFVLWGGPCTRTRSPQQFDYQPWWATHFYPLNRSAIATDAEEQRVKKHDGPCWRNSHSDCGC